MHSTSLRLFIGVLQGILIELLNFVQIYAQV